MPMTLLASEGVCWTILFRSLAHVLGWVDSVCLWQLPEAWRWHLNSGDDPWVFCVEPRTVWCDLPGFIANIMISEKSEWVRTEWDGYLGNRKNRFWDGFLNASSFPPAPQHMLCLWNIFLKKQETRVSVIFFNDFELWFEHSIKNKQKRLIS